MTIKDIAEKAGCAVSTVSRALNDHPDVSEETKQRIRQIVDECGFIPNANAQQLKAQQRNSISVIVKGANNMFFASILERMQYLIASEGYAAEVHYIGEDENEVLAGDQIAREQKPIGIVFLGGNIENFEQLFQKIKIPCVLTSSLFNNLQYTNLSQVGIDDAGAAALACRYLSARGHSRIGIIGGDRHISYISRLRYEGFAAAYRKKYDTDFPDELYRVSAFNIQSGYEAMQDLLSTRPDLTAVFCMSDITALGAMRAAHGAGKSVPDDISLVGFDGIELVRYCTPSLTSVTQPQSKMADTSIEFLLRQIEHKEEARTAALPVSLTEGESVCSRC